MTKETKKWYQSNTKKGTLLIGIGTIMTTVGGYLTGAVDLMPAIQALVIQVGAIMAVFGIRDLPVINK